MNEDMYDKIKKYIDERFRRYYMGSTKNQLKKYIINSLKDANLYDSIYSFEVERIIDDNIKIYYPEEKSLNELAKDNLNKLADNFEKYCQDQFESEADRIVEDAIDQYEKTSKSFKPEWETPKIDHFERSVEDRKEKISEDDLMNLEIAFNTSKTFEEFLNLI